MHTCLIFSSLALLALSRADLKPMRGVLIFSDMPTYGVAAYFTEDGGTAASYICSMATGSDQTCRSFQPAIRTAIGMVLHDLASKNQNRSSIALGDPNSLDTLSPEKRSLQNVASAQDLLDAMGQSNGATVIQPSYRAKIRRSGDAAIHVANAGNGTLRYNMDVHSSGAGDGGVVITPILRAKRDSEHTTSINPLANPESSFPSSGPGFKVTFKNYPQNVVANSLDPSTPWSTIDYFATSMANDWESRASRSVNGSRYLGIYGQGYKMITALEIIPEIRGYGIEQEDPNLFCGPLDTFACLDRAQCSRNAPPPNGICAPLLRDPRTSVSVQLPKLLSQPDTSTSSSKSQTLSASGAIILSQALSSASNTVSTSESAGPSGTDQAAPSPYQASEGSSEPQPTSSGKPSANSSSTSCSDPNS